MRAFMIVCLLAVACADKLGYNYKPVGHSDFGLSFAPGGLSGHVSGVVGYHGVGASSGRQVGSFGGGGSNGGLGIGSHGVGGYSSAGGGFGGQVGGFGVGGSNGGYGIHHASGVVGSHGISGSGFGVGGSKGGVGNGGADGSLHNGGSSIGFNGGASYAPHVELEKEFYTFTAPEDDFAIPHVENQIASTAKKGIRVIFIKGPENNGLENAAVALAKHISEQKTAIYVLQKQADISSLSNKLNSVHNNINNKPEVHFVKYRTHEDAINAQKAIRSQYDTLGGISNNINGGEAPVLNFASKDHHGSHDSHVLQGSIGSSGSAGSSGSLGSTGSHGSSGSSGSVGSVGSSGLSIPSNSYIAPSAPSSTYLPA